VSATLAASDLAAAEEARNLSGEARQAVEMHRAEIAALQHQLVQS